MEMNAERMTKNRERQKKGETKNEEKEDKGIKKEKRDWKRKRNEKAWKIRKTRRKRTSDKRRIDLKELKGISHSPSGRNACMCVVNTILAARRTFVALHMPWERCPRVTAAR